MVLEALARLCGLPPGELAAFLNVPERRVRRWLSGEAPVSAGAMSALRGLHDRQQAAADGLIAAWIEAGQPDEIDFAVAGSHEVARAMGWPGREAQLTVAAIAQAEIAPARIIARTAAPKPGETAAHPAKGAERSAAAA